MDNNTLWYKDAVFYEVYVRAFRDSNGDGHGDLRGLTQKLDYLKDLGIDCLWLMPIYNSPFRDDGYDISDYYNIAEIFGTVEEFKILIQEAHQRGIRIIMDLVMNHTSDEHPWFNASRSDRNSPYRAYYVWSDTDEKYKEARIIFVDSESSNWSWDETTKQYYWHRFYSSQPDLNFANPKVQDEIFKIARFWLDSGIDGFRADAVPYLFEREGTNCENLPETHEYLKKLRAFIDENYPGRILLCEANQWPEDVRPYFGEGDEFQMGFHFPIMPRIFMAIKKGKVDDMVEILNRTPSIPQKCQWCVFLRNHDELTLEMVTEEERQWMWEKYAPDPRMKLNLGIRRRLAPLLDNDIRKITLAYSLLFTLPGSPILYYGDEIGMGDDIRLPDRNGVRTPMQWQAGSGAGFSDAPAESFYAPVITSLQYGPQQVNVESQRKVKHSLWNAIRHMIAIRKQYKCFGWGSFEWVATESNSMAAYQRTYAEETTLILNNLSEEPQPMVLQQACVDVLTDEQFEAGNLELQPLQFRWLKIKA